MIGSETIVGERGHRMGLIGEHATRAMSPALWRPVLERVRPGWTYEAWDADADELASLRERLLGEDIVAFNVTMPHKRWAASTADAGSEAVRRSGAANLLISGAGRLRAHNTDIDAMRGAVAGVSIRRAVVLGAGGAGRAALVALARHAEGIEIADPDPSAVAGCVRFASERGIPVRGIDWDARGSRLAEADMAVNATPVGMHRDDAAVWGTESLDGVALVYDFVYAAHETANVRVARAGGAAVIDGWQHLLRQAQAMTPLLELPEATGDLLDARLAELRASGR